MPNKRLAALIASGVLILGGGVGVAGALEGGHSSSHKTEDVSKVDDDNATPEVENEAPENEVEHEAETTDDSTDDSTTAGPTEDNHGAEVSAVAHDTEPGPDHGKAVSAVARTNSHADGDDDEATENETETETEDDDATEVEAEHTTSNSGPGSATSGHDGGDHHGPGGGGDN